MEIVSAQITISPCDLHDVMDVLLRAKLTEKGKRGENNVMRVETELYLKDGALGRIVVYAPDPGEVMQ